MEIARKNLAEVSRNAMAKVEAAAEVVVVVAAVVTHPDRGVVRAAVGRRPGRPKMMTSRYRRKKTASRRSVTIVRIRTRRILNRTAVAELPPGRATAVAETVVPILVDGAMDREIGGIAPGLKIGLDRAIGLALGIVPVHPDAGPARPEG